MSTYYFRVVADGVAGKHINSYGEAGSFTTLSVPTVSTGAASDLTQTTATLNATVNPNGAAVTQCELEYGPTASYGSSVPCSPAPGAGEAAVAVSAQVTGLTAGSGYHFRVVAENAYATVPGGDESFQTIAAPAPSPAPQQPASPGSTGTTAVPAAELAASTLVASPSGLLAAKITCPAAASGGCAGTITLRTAGAVATGRGKATVLTLTSGAFDLKAGQTATIDLHLTATARKLLARLHTLRVLATVAAHNSAGATHTGKRTATLKLGRATRPKG